MITGVKLEPCKKVETFDIKTKEPNGFLVELYKDGEKTVAYLTSIKPRAFKGYHLHTIRQSHYVCLKGKVKIIVISNGEREEYILESAKPERLLVPTNVYIGLENIGTKEVWLINLPHPPYDPNIKGEQLDKSREELERE